MHLQGRSEWCRGVGLRGMSLQGRSEFNGAGERGSEVCA